ncbi:hypothetical protein COLO4_37397 [Corchorus olitorius]|uniref:Photosystem antenna protein-like protein n=1 Tax=Corchorus olitorius TaxID=93759 RepID=A0A1R3G290_9ROSI|nr:hypothetical protein COLO4_37397 [Corchorus olitorius]
MGLPWYRVHTVVLNDPGRLLSVHIMHTALVADWAGSMALYELAVFDPSDPVLDPMWRQGVACFGFGAFHVTGLYGPGIWVSDPYGLTGKLLLLLELCGMVQRLPPSNYLVLLVINGIKDTFNKKYIEGLVLDLSNSLCPLHGYRKSSPPLRPPWATAPELPPISDEARKFQICLPPYTEFESGIISLKLCSLPHQMRPTRT